MDHNTNNFNDLAPIAAAAIDKVMALARAGIYLTTQQAALYINLSPRTLEKYRRVGGGPTYAVYGARAVRYSIASLDEWKNARLRNTTSETCRFS